MKTEIWTDLVAERCDSEGPVGRFVEVLEVAIVDYGGNEYGRATTASGVQRIRKKLRIQTELKPVRTGKEVAGGVVYCGLCY